MGKNSTADKLKVIRDEFNPFEIKQQRTKFDVMGRKVKGVGGKPALNKQIGEENVRSTRRSMRDRVANEAIYLIA